MKIEDSPEPVKKAFDVAERVFELFRGENAWDVMNGILLAATFIMRTHLSKAEFMQVCDAAWLLATSTEVEESALLEIKVVSK